MSEAVRPDRTLDCVGLYCPKPVFRTRIELDKMNVGQVLEVLTDLALDADAGPVHLLSLLPGF